MSVSIGYTGLTGSNLSWGGSGNALININQLDPKYQAMGGNYTLELVPNPFFGVAGAGQFATRATIERGQLLRPYPQFGNVHDAAVDRRAFAVPRRHPPVAQAHHGVWGGNFSYTYSRLTDNQFGESNYYSSAPGLQNNYTVVPGFAVLQPGPGVRPQPARLAAQDRAVADRSMLPFGEGQNDLRPAVGGHRSSADGRSTPVDARSRAASRSASARTSPARRSCSAARRGRTSSLASTSWCPVTSPTASRPTPPTTST